MQVQKIQNNNTNFEARFDMKPLEGMITREEILKLQKKAKNVGNNRSLIKIILEKPYSRTEGNNYAGTVYHGFNMNALTCHNCKLGYEELGKEVQETSLYDMNGKLKEEFKPFNILNKWLDNVFKPKKSKKYNQTTL